MPRSPAPQCRRVVRGVTFVETLTGLAVSAVLAALSVPQLSNVLGSSAAEASIESFATALRFARAEAVRRGEEVSLCAREPKADDHTMVCAAGGKDWSAGWLVFVDRGQRGTLEAGDLLVQVVQPVKPAPQVLATVRYITFESTGVSFNAASHFDFLPFGNVDAPGARRICVNKPGRLRRLKVVDDCAT